MSQSGDRNVFANPGFTTPPASKVANAHIGIKTLAIVFEHSGTAVATFRNLIRKFCKGVTNV
jgi:hypothetical protein